jgi:phospholipid/cholesterol/gamma-HCH transport system substrate-binding protein
VNRISITMDRLRNVPGLGRDVLLVAVVLALGLASSAYIVSRYDVITPWADKFEFSAEFDQAPAIQLSSVQEVRIAGISVGKIVDSAPTEDGTAVLDFAIDEGHEIYSNAKIIVRSKTPLNVMYVAVDPGGPPARLLPEGATIPVEQTERVLQPYELLDELDGRARAALTDLVTQADVALANAPVDLPSGLAGTNAAMQSFKPVVTELQKRRENIRRLVSAVAQISTAAGADDKRLASLATSLEETLVAVARRDSELAESLDLLPGVTGTLRSSMASAGRLTDQLTPTLKSLNAAANDLPSALKRLNRTVDAAHRLVGVAGPVIAKARPVIADLRPLVADLSAALGDLAPVTSTLPEATARIVPWLDDLGAFVYNTASSFSLGDVNGNIGRAQVVLKVTDPTGGAL